MNDKNLIIYFVPEKMIVNGGVLSIFSQAKESRRYKDLHTSKSFICTYPGTVSYKNNSLFENDEMIYSFDQIVKKYPNPDSLMLHIPECAIMVSLPFLTGKFYEYLINTKLHINVMTQNIELLPGMKDFSYLFNLTKKVTQTTAHSRYTTQTLSDKYMTPIHHMSVYLDENQYTKTPFSNKRDLILYSPDSNPYKDKILDTLAKSGLYELVEIEGLKYQDYKNLISEAKYCISFGEGFDGYFVEPYLSGSIGISVYNDVFFPNEEWRKEPFVFESFEEINSNLLSTLKTYKNKNVYDSTSKAARKLITKQYSFNKYLEKLESFYKKSYDIYPRINYSMVNEINYTKDNKIEEKKTEIVILTNYAKRLKSEKKLAQKESRKLQRNIDRLTENTGYQKTAKLRNFINNHTK